MDNSTPKLARLSDYAASIASAAGPVIALAGLKYEEVYPKAYRTVADAEDGLADYFDFYNARRLHQALKYATPNEVHDGRVKLR
jgi:transposase InsO family protein